jgi:hypothetical protein
MVENLGVGSFGFANLLHPSEGGIETVLGVTKTAWEKRLVR